MFHMHPRAALRLEKVLLDGELTCGWDPPELNWPPEMAPLALLRLFHVLGAHGGPRPIAPASLSLA